MSVHRIYNFSAGPATLPLPVLEEAQRDLVALPNVGMSVMEISHRSKPFDEIIQGAEADFRKLGNVPDNYKVLFLQGGASLQFSMIPMNLLTAGSTADYIVTGDWAKKALKEAKRVGSTHVSASTEEGVFKRIPKQSELKFTPGSAYVHMTSNNTIFGTQWSHVPDVHGAPLVCDASSDIFSKPIDVSKFGLIYAGAQKNIGPAGLVVVIVRDELLGHALPETPNVLDYKLQSDADSMLNTPPTFSVYLAGLTFQWLLERGGLAAMEQVNIRKAARLYDYIDGQDFYSNPIAKPDRSRMNVPFRLRDDALDKPFLAEAEALGLSQLKGHRSVGGMRASIYNAMPVEGVEALVEFMEAFRTKHS